MEKRQITAGIRQHYPKNLIDNTYGMVVLLNPYSQRRNCYEIITDFETSSLLGDGL